MTAPDAVGALIEAVVGSERAQPHERKYYDPDRDAIAEAMRRFNAAAIELRRIGVTLDDPRLGYVEAQVDRDALAEFDAALARLDEVTRG